MLNLATIGLGLNRIDILKSDKQYCPSLSEVNKIQMGRIERTKYHELQPSLSVYYNYRPRSYIAE
jgi:hypothetical protein